MIDYSWKFMGIPVSQAVITLVVALMFHGQNDLPDFLLKLWLCWIPALWFLFGGRSKLWFLPLAAGFPFWTWAAWITWHTIPAS